MLLMLIVGVGTSWAETYTITFLTNSSDGSTTIAANTQVSNVVSAGASYVSGFTSSCSKAYLKCIKGVKLGSSSATGTLEFNIATNYQSNIKSITVKSAKYGSDTGTITLYSGSTSLKTGITPGTDYTHTFTTATTVSSIKLSTSAKRAYISEIVLETDGGDSTDPVDATWSVDPTSVSVKATKTATATITTNYNGTLSVSSANSSIATATINGKVITVTGVAEGNTTLNVTGAATSAYNAINKTIDVTVTANARPANEIFYESFDTNEGSGGNDDLWSGSIASNNIKQDNDGWVFENGSGANECAKFGAGSKLGTATTPALGQACNATLTFKAAAWNGNSESTTLKLSVINGGSVSPATVTMTKGAWKDFEVTLTNLTASSKVKFEGNATSNSRFFLDEVSVVKTSNIRTLQTVTVSGTPTKTTYTAGESFEPAGLTVTGHYDDESDETITEGITWSTPAALTVGQTSVSITATVNGVTSAAYNVTGLTVNAPVTLSSIAASGTPAEFWKGDAFNHDGITVTATWSDDSQTDVTSSATFTGYDMSTAGEQTVTVTYLEKTATYGINVKTIANTQATAYTVAQAKALIDAGKDLATEVYVAGTVSEIVTEYSSSYGNISFNVSVDGATTGDQFQFFRNFKGADKQKWTDADEKPAVGDQVVGFGKLTKYNSTYEFAEGNYIVSLTHPTAKTITALTVSGTPTKTTYNVGDAFETAGLTVTATYSDETTEVITTGFEWEIDYGNGNDAFVAGATSVDVMVYTEDDVMSEVYTVNGLTVNIPVTLTSIAVSGTPTKTEYYAGDAFETAGLVVTGTYSDSHQETITEGIEWTVDPETLTLGTTSVDVMASVGSVVSEVYTVEGLTVTKAPYETVTYNFSSFTSGQSVELTDLEDFVITLKSNGGTNPAWNVGASEARVYAKGSLTVKANNAIIKSIEYDYVVNANSKGVTPTIDGVEGTTTAGTWDVENKTWTGADEEVTFSTSGSAGNIGFTKLIIKYVESSKIETSLAWSATEYEATLGAENVFPTLTTTPADLTGVNYESSNTEVATIAEDGTITLIKEGETIITANYAGNTEYASATPASYTLTVVKAPFVPTPAAEGYEVVDFAALYSSVTTNATVEDYEGTSLAMVFAKPQGSNTPTKYYDNGRAVRAYEGNTITITAAEPIKYIDIAWTVEDDAVSITGLNTTTAVVTFSKTCRFTKVTVSYKGSNSTLVATDGENYYATFSSEKNVVFSNATAYTVSVADDKLTLTEVTRNKVPAGNAVLIKSATTDVEYYYVDGDEDFENNMLVACPTTGTCPTVEGDNLYYKLAYDNANAKTGLGFWYGVADGSNNFNVKAGGAVLVVPQSVGGAVRGFSFDGNNGVVTGLNNLNNLNNTKSTIYNLQGQHISKAQKGVSIVNGRKVIR